MVANFGPCCPPQTSTYASERAVFPLLKAAKCNPNLYWRLPDAPLVAYRRLLDAVEIVAGGKAHVCNSKIPKASEATPTVVPTRHCSCRGGGGSPQRLARGRGGGLQTRASTAAAPCPSHRGSPVMHSLPWCASRCSTSGSANQEWPAQSRCGSSRLSAPKPPSHSPRCPRYHSFRPASISSYVRPSFDRRNRPQTSCNLQEVGGGCWRHWRPPMGG